jgi:cell division protein FtsW
MFGYQIHVFEIVKVAMIMYLAWAINEYKSDIKSGGKGKHFKLAKRLAKNRNFEFLAKPFWKKIMYIYIPILIVTGMVMMGSNSSAVIIGGVMLAVLVVGGLEMKEVWLAIAAVITMVGLAYGTYKLSGEKIMANRFQEMETRLTMNSDPHQLLDSKLKKDRDAWQKRLDKIKQPNAAKIAVAEGGLLGKGPGGSTQKYVLPVVFGDYMFSFLLEEYGLWGGIIIIILYVSLLARGSWIARLCDSDFAKTAVGGLTLLITGQAFLHMYINVGLGPLTGQTLPLVSHGKSAFLAFCVAFGVILSISRMANNKIRQEEAAAEPIYKKDDIQSSLDVLEQIENDEFEF